MKFLKVPRTVSAVCREGHECGVTARGNIFLGVPAESQDNTAPGLIWPRRAPPISVFNALYGDNPLAGSDPATVAV